MIGIYFLFTPFVDIFFTKNTTIRIWVNTLPNLLLTKPILLKINIIITIIRARLKLPLLCRTSTHHAQKNASTLTFPIDPQQHPAELHHGVPLDLRERHRVVHVVDELVRRQLQLAQVWVHLLE